MHGETDTQSQHEEVIRLREQHELGESASISCIITPLGHLREHSSYGTGTNRNNFHPTIKTSLSQPAEATPV